MKLFPSIFLSLLLPLAVAAQSVQIQDGAIRAEFSVSDSTKVYFSQGNLQYQASTNTWRFAEHQFDIVGFDNKNISEKYNGWIDLFGWGTSGYNGKNPYMTSKEINTDYGDGENDIAGTNYDWGVYNKIYNGGNQTGLWRTLTYKEWRYLRYDRTDADALYGTATVNGVNGCIFLPDNWTTPTGVTFKCGANGYSVNTYTVCDWAKMEANGAVFLPTAGSRYGTLVCDVGSRSFCWSSSAYDGGKTSYLYICSDEVGTNDGYRYHGQSVRLVQDVKNFTKRRQRGNGGK